MLVYEDKNEIIPKLEILNVKCNDITDFLIGKKQPEAIIMNIQDNAYFTQIFDERSAHWLIYHSYVYSK